MLRQTFCFLTASFLSWSILAGSTPTLAHDDLKEYDDDELLILKKQACQDVIDKNFEKAFALNPFNNRVYPMSNKLPLHPFFVVESVYLRFEKTNLPIEDDEIENFIRHVVKISDELGVQVRNYERSCYLSEFVEKPFSEVIPLPEGGVEIDGHKYNNSPDDFPSKLIPTGQDSKVLKVSDFLMNSEEPLLYLCSNRGTPYDVNSRLLKLINQCAQGEDIRPKQKRDDVPKIL